MHELGITQQIVDMVTDHAGDAKITRIVIQIGKLSAVLPDAVRYCFDLCSQGTMAEGAMLEIIQTPGLARCPQCDNVVELDQPIGRCQCGETDLQWIGGDELKITEMEIL